MPLASLYALDTVVLSGPVQFSRLSNVRAAPEIEKIVTRPAGHTMPMFVANSRYKPVISFSSGQIDLVASTIPVNGLAISAAAYLYFKLKTATGNAARNATSHLRFIINLGLACWTSCRLPHKGEGSIDVTLYADFDGTNDPLILESGVALPAAQIAGDHFSAGPLKINGSQLTGIQDVTLNSGCRVFSEGSDGDEFDTFVALQTADPTVEWTYRGTALGDISLDGIILNGSTGLLVNGRKYSANAGMLANATAEHIAWQALLGNVTVVEDAGSETELNSGRCMATCVASSDSVLPLVFSDNQAIS